MKQKSIYFQNALLILQKKFKFLSGGLTYFLNFHKLLLQSTKQKIADF
jgi:hypothetical protein